MNILPYDASGFVARITDFESKHLSDADEISKLRQALAQHQVLIINNQDVDNEDYLLELGRLFGKIQVDPRAEFGNRASGGPAYVSNIRENGELIGFMGHGIMGWHHDRTYLTNPPVAVLLAAAIVPDQGGDTCFADMYRAYDTMPQSLLEKIKDLKLGPSTESAAAYSQHINFLSSKQQGAQHPIIFTHPISQRKVIFYGGGYVSLPGDVSTVGITPCFVGMSQADSDRLSEEVFSHIFQPDFVYRHHWQAGDVIIWDNISVSHRRDAWDDVYPRLLKRLTIAL